MRSKCPHDTREAPRGNRAEKRSMVDIRYGDLKDYRDLFAKLKREAERFEKDPSADNLFNTMVTVWCLADWVLADAELTPDMNDSLLNLTGRTPFDGKRDISKMSTEMRICKDIANASKHAMITKYSPEVKMVSFTDGTYGSGPYGFGPYGGGGRRFAVVIVDEIYDAQKVITKAIAQYDDFFEKLDLI
jgi:hypothetical protein